MKTVSKFAAAVASVRTVLFYGVFGMLVIVALFLGWSFTWLSATFSFWMFTTLSKLMVFCLRWIVGVRVQFTGLEILERAKREFGCFLLAPKHQSSLETLIFSIFLHPFKIVCKQEIFKLPIVSRYLQSMNFISLDRKAGRKAVMQLMESGMQAKEQGAPILIFPEGTRVPLGQRGRYHAGVALMSSQLQIPIVPVAHNAGISFQKNRFALLPGVVTFQVLEPILPGPTNELLIQLEDQIETACAALP